MKRYEYAKIAEECRELEKQVKSMRKVAKRANRLVVESKDELGLTCFVVLKELEKILAAAKKMKKIPRKKASVEISIDNILEIAERLQDRVHEVHEE